MCKNNISHNDEISGIIVLVKCIISSHNSFACYYKAKLEKIGLFDADTRQELRIWSNVPGRVAVGLAPKFSTPAVMSERKLSEKSTPANIMAA